MSVFMWAGRLHLGLTLCVAWPCVAIANDTTAPDEKPRPASVIDLAPTYSCVDATDASARRSVQQEPCKLPMYQLPVTRDATARSSTRWPTYPPKSPEADGAHPMFWRFPVQPGGPHEVPRHSRR